MDYKYIEILIEHYFNCETTVEEERILKAFFQQKDVPDALSKYAPIFNFETAPQQDILDEDFDERVLERLNTEKDTHVKYVRIKKMTWAARFRPLTHAAAAVAIVALIGDGLHRAYMTATFTPIEETNKQILEAEINASEIHAPVPGQFIQPNEEVALAQDSLRKVRNID